MNKKENLDKAKKSKNDEFYTQLEDIERELQHYKDHFRDKIVYCNCDDPMNSNFFKYFSLKFHFLELRELITTSFKDKAICIRYKGDLNNIESFPLEQNGDFRSEECKEILSVADIVVTNPPFSLFRKYLDQLIEFNKKFIIIGSLNAVSYKEIFPLLKENKIWIGVSTPRWFEIPAHYPLTAKMGKIENNRKYIKNINGLWFTNLSHQKQNEKLILYKNYTPEEYPTYDNYDAINVDKTKEIPADYYGEMGVPISFFIKYNPEQFEIINIFSGKPYPYINGKKLYARIIIKRK